MKYFFDSITSKAYWQYIFSKKGFQSIFAIFGAGWLIIETLDFFNVYTRDQYASYSFLILLLLSLILSILLRRPIQSFSIPFLKYDFNIEVKIIDLFEVDAAAMISTNTQFEADVAGSRIAIDSLQGQFTAQYFPGNQTELIEKIREELNTIDGTAPYPMGTTIPIHTHGKTFYWTVMAEIGERGNASTNINNIKDALNGLWRFVRETGELQKLAVPILGTGRGRIRLSRKKMIALIAESFVKASEENKFTDRLIITLHPNDSKNFEINLYEIKDHLVQVLK